MKNLILLSVLISTSVLAQQSQLNSYTVGDTTYQNGVVNGQIYSSRAVKIGNRIEESITQGGTTITCVTFITGSQQTKNCH